MTFLKRNAYFMDMILFYIRNDNTIAEESLFYAVSPFILNFYGSIIKY
ncbi:MAG: hypothetical protein RL160_1231 [Bacteroidota bacterium]